MPDDPVSRSDFVRLERKVDELHNDWRALVTLAERQAEQGRRIGELESRMKSDEDVTKNVRDEMKSWINRGIGVWVAAAAIFAVVNAPNLISLFRK